MFFPYYEYIKQAKYWLYYFAYFISSVLDSMQKDKVF